MELLDYLDGNRKDRKRELIAIESRLKDARKTEVEYLKRSCVVISYAHWEGYIKQASIAYVTYVSNVATNIKSLGANFKALACRSVLLGAQSATKRIMPHIKVINLITSDTVEKFSIDPISSIDTESNLNWEVFENICNTIGIDTSPRWHTYKPLINDMVTNRCFIAHGEIYYPSDSEAKDVVKFVLDAMDWFTTDIMNAVATNAYLK